MLTNILVRNVPRKKNPECVNCLCCQGGFQQNTTQGCVELLSGPPSEYAKRLRESRGSGGASQQAWWCSERSGYSERGGTKASENVSLRRQL